MNTERTVAVLLCFLTVLAGCGGNTRKVACTGENWHQMGIEFASEGRSVRAFDVYRDQCGEGLEHGAMSAYLDGYTKGLVMHCTYENGYNRGFNNRQAVEHCPLEMRALYMKGYTEGERVREGRVAEMERNAGEWDQDQGREDFGASMGNADEF